MTPRVWDIIGKRKWGYLLSVALIIPGVTALILNAGAGRGALNWGIDFTGGDLLQLRVGRPFTTGQVRTIVDQYASGESIIQKSDEDLLIRTRPLEAKAKADMLAHLKREFATLTVLREEEVQPKIGEELRNVAIIGVVVGLALQVLYISIRFRSIRYAVTADAALLHDLLVVTGIFALTRKEVNSSFVAVLLTVVGYSINDTIVVYDRLRENLALRTREAFERLVNRSLLEALVRSINTVMTTLLAIAAVYVFGGSTIRDFTFGLMAGIFTGAYSSVFNASALLVDWYKWSERRSGRARQEATTAVTVSREPALEPGGPGSAPAHNSTGQGARRRRSRRR